jgi:hypothetical protein
VKFVLIYYIVSCGTNRQAITMKEINKDIVKETSIAVDGENNWQPINV